MRATRFAKTAPSTFGPFTILWCEETGHRRVARIYLSDSTTSSEEKARQAGSPFVLRTCAPIDDLSDRILAFLAGQAITFDLAMMDMTRCSPFQRRVLEAEHTIPRGWISTYGLIGRHVGVPKGGRAVGGALARNPFPIVIPCHRAIRADHTLGGYQGGMAMKRDLLRAEGLRITTTNHVLDPRIYYAP